MLNNKGFTLIEMLVTTALVVIVIMITGSAFESILKTTGRLISSEESNVEGVIGLEMFRHDLLQAGYGLPDTYQSLAPTYSEALFAPANLLNDAPSGVPRPIVSLEGVTVSADSNSSDGGTYSVLSGTDYLAVKATTVGRSKAAKKWTYLNYSASSGSTFSQKAPYSWPNTEDNLKSSDKAIVIKRTFSDTWTTSTLIFNNNNTGVASTYWPSNPTVNMSDNFNPSSTDPTYYIYGVDDGTLGMPFNRADFFVARPSSSTSIPTVCAPNTGILYKATVNHADGKLNYMPLLDCVADMQVVLGWDVNLDGVITESSAYSATVSQIAVSGTATAAAIQALMLDPVEMRKRLKYIKVYLMVQEGRKDTGYTNSNNLMNGTYAVVAGDANTSATLANSVSNVSITKGYTVSDLTAKGWQNYRWKIYRIVARPKNIAK